VYVPHADATAHTDADVYVPPHAATHADPDPDVYLPHADATAVEPAAASAERQPEPVADDAAFRDLVAVAARTPGVDQR
jgi:hypothetical protein